VQELFKTETPPSRPRWLRVSAGVLVLVFTLILTLAMLLLSLCLGFMAFGNPDNLLVPRLLLFVTAIVPIAGTWLGVRLLRKPKSARSMEKEQ
jgi:hypothetical protein